MNKLSKGLLALAKALEDLAYEHETEITQQNDRLNDIEETAARTRSVLKDFAQNILINLQ